jgi:purine-nucleoside phosphorylase
MAGLLEPCAHLVAQKTTLAPTVGVVLGSGLGAFGGLLDQSIAYRDLPGMPQSRVAGHAGNLRLGKLSGVGVACLQGRVHLYEGHGADAVAFGVRLLAKLGCKAVLLTNAAGSVAAELSPGDLMLITDQLNLTGRPLDFDADAPFTDMTDAYDGRLRVLAHHAGSAAGIALREGVYAGLLGPAYETPAEIRMLRSLGADAVGMSTVVEVIALRRLGVRVGAISCITNWGAGLSAVHPSHADVQEVAGKAEKALVELLVRWVALAGREVSP